MWGWDPCRAGRLAEESDEIIAELLLHLLWSSNGQVESKTAQAFFIGDGAEDKDDQLDEM